MSSTLKRILLLVATGGMMLQVTTCITDRTLASIDTVLLGAVAGIAYYIATKA
jgi:hypothetical protein